jgi:LacI family transcriptional regulator
MHEMQPWLAAMKHKQMSASAASRTGAPVSLKELARHLELSPSTVSVVLNEIPGRSISEGTRARIKEAAERFQYRPSFLARSLRRQKTQTVGVLLPQVGEGYHAQVLSGIANELERNGYFYLIAQHRHDPKHIIEYTEMLVSRGAEGFVAIDTRMETSLRVPTVSVAGHKRIMGITNVVLNHEHAARLTMRHLRDLGHREIAVIKGQATSSDTLTRWRATAAAARDFGLSVPRSLSVQLERDVTSPEIAYTLVQRLLRGKRSFTAIVCFNDIAALGAIRALNDAGIPLPAGMSVVGFDDISLAVFATPSITTIRQPLQQMGETAARVLLERLRTNRKYPTEIAVEPELIVRESTGISCR